MSRTLAAPPGLAEGMRLDWDEFEARWNDLPDVRRAELIDGVVRMPPSLSDNHADPDNTLATWLGTYRAYTPGTRASQNPTVRLDARNAPQPDAILRIDRRPPAERVLIRPRTYPGPQVELVVEVGVSSAAADAGVKRELYQRFGIPEYLAWDVDAGTLEWLALRPGGYAPLPADAAGVLRSEVFPGLWLDTPALLRDDPAAVLATLARGLDTPEHAAFVERLRAEYES